MEKMEKPHKYGSKVLTPTRRFFSHTVECDYYTLCSHIKQFSNQ